MPFNKMNIYWNQQPMSQQQNQFFQPPTAPGQFGIPLTMPKPQGNFIGNQGWGAGPQNAGAQGYTTPGYPPQSFGRQPTPQRMPMSNQILPMHGFPSQGYSSQQYTPQGFKQGYGGQMPDQPVREEPKKGGIKGFLSNLIAKRKR